MAVGTILAIASTAGTGYSIYSGVQQQKEAKKERKKQEDLNKQRQAEIAAGEAKRIAGEKRAETTGQRVGFGFRSMFAPGRAASTGFSGNEDKPITRGTLFGN